MEKLLLKEEEFLLKKRLDAIFLAILIIIIFCCGIGVSYSSADTEIQKTNFILSGKVKLPEGEVAPKGGIGLVFRFEDPFTGEPKDCGVYPEISEGQSEVAYSIPFVKEDRKVRIWCGIREGGYGYVGVVYYGKFETQADKRKADLLNLNDGSRSNLDITLQKAGCILSGKVKLPAGEVASKGGIGLAFRVEDTFTGEGVDGGAWPDIPEGQNEADYLLTLPKMDASVRIWCGIRDGGQGYVGVVYYGESGTQFDKEKASVINLKEGNRTNLNVTLQKAGCLLSGKVKLPTGKVAPKGGIGLAFRVENAVTNQQVGVGTWPDIKEGESETDYMLTMPQTDIPVRIWCGIREGGQGYISSVYYNESDTQVDQQKATVINLSEGSKTNLNINLPEAGRILGGKVRLPLGDKAPDEGIGMSIRIENAITNEFLPVSTWVQIPRGNNEVDYSMAITETDIPVRIWFSLSNEFEKYVRVSYYSNGNAQFKRENATVINLNEGSKTDLDMVLRLVNSPQTQTKSSGISVTIDKQKISFDVEPQLVEGRTLVPLRKIFEALGAEVLWDSSSRTVIGTKGSKFIKLTIDSTNAYVNGVLYKLEVPARIIDGRTMVPVRFISESFGCKVDWDAISQTVSITNNF